MITVEADGSIDDALADMNRLGVHALYPQASSPNKGCIIPVADVMTLWNELTVVNYESLQTLTALDVYEMFQGTGLTHLLVIENHGDESAVARGLLSRATLAENDCGTFTAPALANFLIVLANHFARSRRRPINQAFPWLLEMAYRARSQGLAFA